MTAPAEPEIEPEIPPATGRWAALPRWARIGLIALVAVVVALVAVVVVRVVTRVPPIPVGATAVGDLREGSCLAEADLTRETYTVVPCNQEHPIQVFATASLELEDSVYTTVGQSLVTFGDEVCQRYLEYRLFLVDDLAKNDFEAYAIAVPDPLAYAAGDTDALCVIAPLAGGMMTNDHYQAMP